MNRIKVLALALIGILTLLTSPPAQAQSSDPLGYFSGSGTAIGTTNSNFVVSGAYGTPRVQFLNVTSDKAASKASFLTPSAFVTVTLATNASQAVIWAPGTGFSANDAIVVRNVAADTYQRLTVSSSTATNITCDRNLSAAVAAGDLVYKMTLRASMPVGAATKEWNAYGGAVVNGSSGQPLLVDVDSTTTVATINACSGIFVR